MTKLLDLAIEKIRKLPETDQDANGEMPLWTIESRGGPVPLDNETVAAISEGLADVRRGNFVPDTEVDELWKCIRS